MRSRGRRRHLPSTSPQEDKTMNGKLVLGLCLGVIGLASAGCSSTPGIVRAQAPPEGAVMGTPDHPCPECGSTDGTCSHCCIYNPHHRFWSHYTPPDAAQCHIDHCGGCKLGPCSTYCDHGPLVYPPNPTPGAIVQYPYYTCKGPDDFFFPQIGAGQPQNR
jgi:hypothetical protein